MPFKFNNLLLIKLIIISSFKYRKIFKNLFFPFIIIVINCIEKSRSFYSKLFNIAICARNRIDIFNLIRYTRY